jgi:hypothetical protein
MGRAKEQMLRDEYDEDFTSFLKTLLEQDRLQGALQGIAKQAISKGVNSLSEKQKEVVDNFIEQYKEKNVCERCSNGNVSSLSDYIEIADDGLCSMCQYDREKYMRD